MKIYSALKFLLCFYENYQCFDQKIYSAWSYFYTFGEIYATEFNLIYQPIIWIEARRLNIGLESTCSKISLWSLQFRRLRSLISVSAILTDKPLNRVDDGRVVNEFAFYSNDLSLKPAFGVKLFETY